VDDTVCASSAQLSRRVLAFPCHQELREHELAGMLAAITEALAS
jgi:dTDP-4-amino-4,6-dideoxygalactose transaminase